MTSINGHAGMIMMGLGIRRLHGELGFKAGKDFDFFPAPGTADRRHVPDGLFDVPARGRGSSSPGEAFPGPPRHAPKRQGAFAILKGVA